MRKADYQTLARLIRDRRAVAKTNKESWSAANVAQREYWRGWENALSHVAHTFADSANVDFDKFLKECGIE